MNGYLKLYRKVFSSDLWQEPRKRSAFEAWLDLLNMAAWRPCKRHLGSRVFRVKRGQLVTTRTYLAKRWGWSSSRVRRFLDGCQEADRLSISREGKFSRIEVVNYEEFQGEEFDLKAPPNQSGPAQEPVQEDLLSGRVEQEILDVWDYYLTVRRKAFESLGLRLVQVNLTGPKRDLIRRSLANYSKETIAEAIRKVVLSDYHMARGRHRGGKYRLGIEDILNVNGKMNQIEFLCSLDERTRLPKDRMMVRAS